MLGAFVCAVGIDLLGCCEAARAQRETAAVSRNILRTQSINTIC